MHVFLSIPSHDFNKYYNDDNYMQKNNGEISKLKTIWSSIKGSLASLFFLLISIKNSRQTGSIGCCFARESIEKFK